MLTADEMFFCAESICLDKMFLHMSMKFIDKDERFTCNAA